MARSDDSLATLLLTNHLTETPASPLRPKAYWNLVDDVGEPGRLFGLGSRDIVDLVGEPELADRILALLEAATQLAIALERFESQGFSALTPLDEGYPDRLRERLGHRAPPALFATGPVQLLGERAIGIVGSRNVDDRGAELAEEAARVAVAGGFAVVSGGARGADQRSMAATYRAGGRVIGYLAESLKRRVKTRETRQVVMEGAVCLATPFKPDAGFSPANAMARNKLIYATGQTTLVVATDEGTGGTWSGATEAIRHRCGHVAVWLGEGHGPGNSALAEAGATPIDDLARLLDEPAPSSMPPEAEQIPLSF